MRKRTKEIAVDVIICHWENDRRELILKDNKTRVAVYRYGILIIIRRTIGFAERTALLLLEEPSGL